MRLQAALNANTKNTVQFPNSMRLHSAGSFEPIRFVWFLYGRKAGNDCRVTAGKNPAPTMTVLRVNTFFVNVIRSPA